jgi:hypothetical protein
MMTVTGGEEKMTRIFLFVVSIASILPFFREF